MVWIPSRAQVRITRSAISPRLAIRTERIGRGELRNRTMSRLTFDTRVADRSMAVPSLRPQDRGRVLRGCPGGRAGRHPTAAPCNNKDWTARRTTCEAAANDRNDRQQKED